MGRKLRRRVKNITSVLPPVKENLYKQTGSVPLNIAQTDRITFSVLRNLKRNIRKVENISYEIQINEKWEWIVRYDDHGGLGPLHCHFRLMLNDERIVESSINIKDFKSKDEQLTWACKDIKRNYLVYRSEFLKNNGFDLY